MQTLSEIQALLEARGLRPRKRFGQNFLHDKNQIRRLVDAAGVAAGDLVLEVGPGTGALTEALLDAGATVIACEIDDGLAALIADRLGDRVTLVHGDCLERGRRLSPKIVAAIDGRPFALVANLPYQAASPLMATLLLEHPNCTGQFVTIQKEVAERLLARPGTKAFGPLTIIVRAFADVRRIGVLGPTCFWPAPQVDSAMVGITPRRDHGVADPAGLARFVTELFTKRRKQLGTTLGRDRPWPAGVVETMRPDALTVQQIIDLWKMEHA